MKKCRKVNKISTVLKNCVSVDLNRYLSVTDFCMKISTPGQRSSSFKKSCTV